MAVGDVNGDGRPDIVAGNFFQPSRLYLNNGDGDFFAGTNVTPLGMKTSSVALGDMDAVGDLDLVVGTYGEGNWVYLNDGQGHFTARVPLGSEKDFTSSLAISDLNNDGQADVVVGNLGLDLSFLVDKGLEAKDFLENTAVDLAALVSTGLVNLRDLLKKGLLDALQFTGAGDVSIADLVNTGTTSLGQLVHEGLVGIDDFVDKQLSREGLLRAGISTEDVISDLCPPGGTVGIRHLLEKGLVLLDNLVDAGLVGLDDLAPGAADLNVGQVVSLGGATIDDLVEAGFAGPSDFDGGAVDLRALIDSGLVTLGQLIDENLLQPAGIDLSKLDANTLRDALRSGAPTRVYRNTGSATFAAPLAIALAPTQTVATADVDGDGDADVVLGNTLVRPQYVKNLFVENGTLEFAAATDVGTVPDDTALTTAVALADIDGDGHPDLVVGNRGTVNRLYLFDPGTGTRSEEHTSELQSRGHLVCRLLLETKKNRTRAPLRKSKIKKSVEGRLTTKSM